MRKYFYLLNRIFIGKFFSVLSIFPIFTCLFVSFISSVCICISDAVGEGFIQDLLLGTSPLYITSNTNSFEPLCKILNKSKIDYDEYEFDYGVISFKDSKKIRALITTIKTNFNVPIINKKFPKTFFVEVNGKKKEFSAKTQLNSITIDELVILPKDTMLLKNKRVAIFTNIFDIKKTKRMILSLLKENSLEEFYQVKNTFDSNYIDQIISQINSDRMFVKAFFIILSFMGTLTISCSICLLLIRAKNKIMLLYDLGSTDTMIILSVIFCSTMLSIIGSILGFLMSSLFISKINLFLHWTNVLIGNTIIDQNQFVSIICKNKLSNDIKIFLFISFSTLLSSFILSTKLRKIFNISR